MIIKLENNFSNLEGYNCFACSPVHPFGLKLEFYFDTDKDIVFTNFNMTHLYAGFPGIIHGGIQATILDEVAFWGSFAKYKKSGFTYDLSLRYKKKCPTNVNLTAIGKIKEIHHKIVSVDVHITNESHNIIYTSGTVRYYLPDSDPRSKQ